jgi:hypothetical protein
MTISAASAWMVIGPCRLGFASKEIAWFAARSVPFRAAWRTARQMHSGEVGRLADGIIESFH